MSKMVIPGAIGTVTLANCLFAITSFSIDGGRTFINVAAYGGPGCEEFINGLLRTGVTLRGFITGEDPNLIPTVGATAALEIVLDPNSGPSGKKVSYIDTVLPGPCTLVGSYAGVNEYSLTVGHASGYGVGPQALRS